MKNLIEKLKSNPYLVAFIALGVIAFVVSPSPEKKSASLDSENARSSVDTFIPRGYVLVPIEVANAESLSSLIGDLGGVVDLYLVGGENKKSNVKVGSKLKLLKAPRDPQQYAVLVRDSESTQLLSYPGPFIAVVQNPGEKGTRVTSSSTAPQVRVEYQN